MSSDCLCVAELSRTSPGQDHRGFVMQKINLDGFLPRFKNLEAKDEDKISVYQKEKMSE